ncbi:septum formation family protein [Frondihabitans cladoniiphilus]|uniref:septum formation family protein n=1 Tax=Frondihabitans cladoniiphilus TaxID=715785 RepID=UPI0031EE1830
MVLEPAEELAGPTAASTEPSDEDHLRNATFTELLGIVPAEVEPEAPQRTGIGSDLQQDAVTAPVVQPLHVAPVAAESGARDEVATPAEPASAALHEPFEAPDAEVEDTARVEDDAEVEDDPFALLFGDIVDDEADVEPETHEGFPAEHVDVLEPDDERLERTEDDPSAWADVPVTPLPPVVVDPSADDEGEQMPPVGAQAPPVGSEKTPVDAPTALLPTAGPSISELAEPDAPKAVVPAATPSPFAPGSFLSAESRLGRNTPVDPVDPNRVPESWVAAQTPAAEGPTKGDGGDDTSGGDRRILVLIGVVVAFLVVLVLLFFLGRAISTHGAGAASPSSPSAVSTTVPTPSSAASAAPSASSAPPEASPTVSAPAAVATGPASPGTHQWTDLNGGECVSEFQSAWQQTYSVVDCATPHAAQLVAKAALPDAAGTAYPGDAALQGRMTLLCSSSSVINLGAAKAYSDIQVSGSYPSRASEWTAGDRTYYCFVSRANGATLTSSLAAGA